MVLIIFFIVKYPKSALDNSMFNEVQQNQSELHRGHKFTLTVVIQKCNMNRIQIATGLSLHKFGNGK